MGIYNRKQYKKKGSVKKKPKSVKQYDIFARNLESNEIEIPTLQTNTSVVANNQPSQLINYFLSWNGVLAPQIITVYTFDENKSLNRLILQRTDDAVPTTVELLWFYISIVRGTTVMFRWDYNWEGFDRVTGLATGQTIFNDEIIMDNTVFQAGDKILWTVVTNGVSTGNQDMRIKGVLN